MDIETREIAIRNLRPNRGEVEGLPRNPRKISKKQLEKLKKSLQDAPEMLRLRELIVIPHEGEFVVIAGNQRLEAAKAVGMTALPCKVLPADTDPAKLREYAIKDNLPFGEDDWEVIASDWDTAELEEWGMSVPDKWESKRKAKYISAEDLDQLLNDAMADNVKEWLEQYDILMDKGWIMHGLTAGLCRAKFLKAKYTGADYPSYLANYFTPEKSNTSAGSHKKGLIDVLRDIKDGKSAGVKGLRTFSEDGILNVIITKGSYPIAGSSMCLDFPSKLARSLYDEFSPQGRPPRVLDPCHGWGGRLIGALLADVQSYTGIDPSEYAHKGVGKIRDTFGPYSPDTRVELIKKPFEDVELESEKYDIALTSPPYFDVEKYEGKETSSERYKSYELWKNGFYRVLIENTFNALVKGGYFILQVGSQRYPLADDGKQIAKEAGFMIKEVRNFGFSTNSKLHNTEDDRKEKILILQKP